MNLVNAIGPGHRIWWPKITRFYVYSRQQNAWNQALDQRRRRARRLLDVGLADRDGARRLLVARPDPPVRRRLPQAVAVMAREITADLALARHVGGDAPLAPAIGAAAEFVPLPPDRVLDTRDSGGPPVAGGSAASTIDMTPYVPAGDDRGGRQPHVRPSRPRPGFLTGLPVRPPTQDGVERQPRCRRAARRARGRAAVGERPPVRVHPRHRARDRRPAGRVRAGSPDGARFTPLDPRSDCSTRARPGARRSSRSTRPPALTAVADQPHRHQRDARRAG